VLFGHVIPADLPSKKRRNVEEFEALRRLDANGGKRVQFADEKCEAVLAVRQRARAFQQSAEEAFNDL
jgi:hypothetical protein